MGIRIGVGVIVVGFGIRGNSGSRVLDGGR